MINLLVLVVLIVNLVILITYWRRDQNKVYAVFILSILFLFGATIYRDTIPEWKGYQIEYKNMLLQMTTDPEQKKNIEKIAVGIKQIWNPELGIADRCVTCHLGVSDLRLSNAPQPYKTHPVIFEDHHVEKFGCTICHYGQGRATEKKDAHGYVIHWERPMLKGGNIQASCIKCHSNERIDDAYLLSKGIKLIKESGCFGCHNISAFKPERLKIGPELDRVGSKVNLEWLFRWIKDPKSYLPKTRMPKAMLSDEDAKAIAAYLMRLTDPNIPEEPIVKDKLTPEARIQKGMELIETSRCINCHEIEGLKKEGFLKVEGLGPSLINIKTKVKKGWLVEWVKNAGGLHPETPMPTFNFTDEQALSVAEYLFSQKGDLPTLYISGAAIKKEDILDEALIERGEKLILDYGCFGCHNIKGIDAKVKIGPDLDGIGSKELEKFDFGKMTGKIHHTREDWIFTKLKTPRVFSDILKMPDFGFTDDEAKAITSVLLGLVDETIPAKYIKERTVVPVFAGSFGRLVEKYKCQSCHKIKGVGGDIGPNLTYEGSKVKKEWLIKFLKSPYKINPLLEARMPNFVMSDDEIRVIADFIELALSHDNLSRINLKEYYNEDDIRRGETLFKTKYGCIACHSVVGGEVQGRVGPNLVMIGERLTPDWIFSWLKDNRSLHPKTTMPNFKLPDKAAASITAYLISLKEVSR